MESWIETYSGKQLHFMNASPEEIDIEDIAHALGMICRFTGQCSSFYSVAEHSWHVSRLLPSNLALAGLLHDAGEAYLTDIASPIKQHLHDYKSIEHALEQAICNKFKLDFPMNPMVKGADMMMLSTEAHYLLPSKGNQWQGFWEHYGHRPSIVHWAKPMSLTPQRAKELFLERYHELIREEYE